MWPTDPLVLLVLVGYPEHILHVLLEAEILQRFGDVLACDRLLSFLLGDLVRLRRDQRDKLDAAFDEQVPGVSSEAEPGRGRQDLGDDLLNRRWRFASAE